MILNLDASIEGLKSLDDVKVILRQIVSGINATEESNRVARFDVLFEGEAGPVLKGEDGVFYRCSITMGASGAPTWTLTSLGKTKPSNE